MIKRRGISAVFVVASENRYLSAVYELDEALRRAGQAISHGLDHGVFHLAAARVIKEVLDAGGKPSWNGSPLFDAAQNSIASAVKAFDEDMVTRS